MAALVLGSLWIGAATQPAAAQARGAGQADQVRAQRDQLFAQRAKAWELFYAGKYEDAARLAQPLLNAPRQDVQAESAHLLARCYWAAGNQRARARAQSIWQELEKVSSGTSTGLRLQIARSLHLNADEKNPQAIALLEDIVRRDSGGTVIVEAGIELGRLYVEEKRFDDARKALEFAESFLKKDRLPQLELTEIEAAPFTKAAREAKAKLKYDANAGLAEFEQAEKLRKAEKFREAAAIYQKIFTTWPDSDYAPRSELAIGHCLIGMKQLPKAAEHWQQFIGASPSGPWRGQAHVALIDLFLEHRLDLDQAARQAALVRNHLDIALNDEKAAPSWNQAGFDLFMRLGMVEMAQGRRGAAEWLERAARTQNLSSQVQESLASLIAAANAGKSVLPDDLQPVGAIDPTNPASRIHTALTLGVIHNVAGDNERAQHYFERVGQGEFRGATRAQVAFAAFGQGAALQGQRKTDEAKAAYLASLNTHPAGAWQDETLYRVALLIQLKAEASSPSETNNRPTAPAQPVRQIEQLKQRRETDRMAQSEALPYWMDLLKRFPQSRRFDVASYHAGVLLFEDQQIDQGAKVLRHLITTSPQSPWSGEAFVRLIDIALERTFDLEHAQRWAAAGVQWVERLQESEAVEHADATHEPWRVTAKEMAQPPIERSVYEIHLRAGLTAYLRQDYDRAVSLLRAAGPEEPPQAPSSQANLAHIGLHYLIKAASTKKSVTDERALTETAIEQQRVALQLGDLYLECIRPDKAEAVLLQLAEGDPLFGRISIETEAYAIQQLALALDRQKGKRQLALEWLSRLRDRRYERTYWGPHGLFRLGVFTYNQTQDPAKSLPIYQEVLRKFPNHPAAETAHLYLFLDLVQLKRFEDAAQMAAAFNKRYPDSEWKQVIQDNLKRISDESSTRKGR